MKSDFLKNCGGFTPAPDEITGKYENPVVAYIWGVVWRFCQGKEGVCTASVKVIADRAKISRRSCYGYLQDLISDGFIEDLDPNVRNRPHRLSTKIGEQKIIGVQNLHTSDSEKIEQPEEIEGDQSENGMQNLPTSESDGVQNLHSRCAEFAYPGVQNLHMKKEEKIDPKIILPKGSGEKPQKPKSDRPPPVPSFKVFVDITKCYGVTTYWRKQMAETVGEEPEKLKLWEDILIGWTGNGWNPRNVKGQLECFGRGEIPGKERTNGHNRDRNQQLFGTGEELAQRPVFDPYTGDTVYPDGSRVKLP